MLTLDPNIQIGYKLESEGITKSHVERAGVVIY